MNDLQIFTNEQFGEVRTIAEGDKVLFCGSDVAKALGYVKPHNAVSTHCKGVTLKQGNDELGRPQEMAFITEGDLYRLITHSKLPSAEKFERWVFDEVLPTIRKTGGYVANDDLFINTYLPYADEQVKMMLTATLQTIRSQNARIEADKPKVLFADAVTASKTSILVGDLAKLMKQNGISIGRDRLFERLRKDGYLISRKGSEFNMPTQRSMEMRLFEIKETVVNHSGGHIETKKTPKVTGKGQYYFINKYLQ